MVESFTPRVGAATQDSKVEQSSDGQGRPPIRWGQGIQIRPSKNLSQTSDSSSRSAATLLPISPAEVSEASSKLQRENARIQRDLDQKKAELADIRHRMDELIKEKDYLAGDNDRKQQLIKSLHQELAGDEAELDDNDDDPLLHRLRRECERRVKDCEERLKKSQAEGEMQSILIDKIKHDLRYAQGEADDAQRGAITMFNEQKRYELNIQRLQSDVHRANTSMEKMRTEAVNLRMKIQELRDERTDPQARDSTIADL